MSSTRRAIKTQIITAGDMSGDVTSSTVDLTGYNAAKIELVFTGAPVGTFAVQERLSESAAWATLDFAATISASGAPDTHILNLNFICTYQIRVVYTRTSGTGSLDAWIKAQEG